MKRKKGVSKVFFIFLFISLGFWFLTTLSKTYTTTLDFPIVFKNIPQNKRIKDKKEHNIKIEIEATGFKILACKFFRESLAFQANKLQKKTEDSYYLITQKQKNNILKQLPSKLNRIFFLKDTLFLKVDVLQTRKIAIKPNININYKIGYELLNDIKLQPDSIMVSGPKLKLDKIRHISLEKLELENVHENFSEEVFIKKDTSYNFLTFNKNKIKISGKVIQFTEGSLEIPFEIININTVEKNELTTLVKQIKLTFTVGLTDYEKIKKEDFLVVCDYKLSKENNLNFLIPKLKKKPSLIKNYSITPNKIDFLINK